MDSGRMWYTYFTSDVAAKARTDDMLQDLVLAIVHAAADHDMYATNKADPALQDHESSYWYFRELLDRLGIPPQAIIDVIDDCYPDNPAENLTEHVAANSCAI